jgi:hypothetical protein
MVAAMLCAVTPSAIDLEALQRGESESLLGNLVGVRARLQLLSEACFEQGELHAAVSVERAYVGSLELTAKLLGQLVQHHHTTHTSILVSPDYLRLRQAIITALRPHPQAARDVSAALHALESEAATEIKASAAKGKPPLLIERRPRHADDTRHGPLLRPLAACARRWTLTRPLAKRSAQQR